jgi:NAD(P)-dependent dehydrogenase (short-subunit alcohol dehydrogenase family)
MSPPAVIVTGGSRGIGRGIVEALSRRGDSVLAVGRDEGALREVRASCGALGCVADITDPDGRASILEAALGAFGRVNVLVHSAGQAYRGDFLRAGADAIRAQIELGLEAPAQLTRVVVPKMSEGGVVIFIGSSVAARPAPGLAVYAATKAALEGLTRSLAVELGPLGIRVNGVAPGVVPTAIITGALGESTPEVEAGLDRLRRLHPLGRLGTPDDIAEAIEYLIDANFVTGTVLAVDGGLTLG